MITQCSNCSFWIKEKNNNFGQCRREPPKPKVISGGLGMSIGPYNYRTIWPYTRDIDGCGEGKPGKPNILNEEMIDQSTINETRKSPGGSEHPFDEAVRKARGK